MVALTQPDMTRIGDLSGDPAEDRVPDDLAPGTRQDLREALTKMTGADQVLDRAIDLVRYATEAIELLSSMTVGRLGPAVGARLVAETGGNPLALVELARELSPGQLAGSEALPDPLPIGVSLQHAFGGRINRLSADARLLLAVAAAEPTAAADRLFRAAEELGVDAEASLSVDFADPVEFTPDVVLRHPLVRSAAHHGVSHFQQRLIHRAVAADAHFEPDRAGCHLAMAATGPDETVAARLEEAAERQCDRGGYAATTTFRSRSAQLPVDEDPRTRRPLGASGATWAAGQHDHAGELLDLARAGPTTELQAGMVLRVSGQFCLAGGQLGEATSRLLAAARTLMPVDPSLGRQTLLHALEAANQAGRAAYEEVCAFAAEILPVVSTSSPGLTLVDRLLFGFLQLFAGEYRQAAGLLRCAIAELLDQAVPEDLRLPWMRLGSHAASELLDLDAYVAIAVDYVRLARRRGALTALPMGLNTMADAYMREGLFVLAEEAHLEGLQIAAATANSGLRALGNLQDLALLCWRGREEEARAVAAEATADALQRGLGWTVGLVHARLAVLELGLGNYRAALACLTCYREDPLSWGTWLLPELVEAAARCAERGTAQQALDRLTSRAQASGAPWALGLLARSRALVADNSDAEMLYNEAIALLDATPARLDAARSHLVYGEWLRRCRRRRDARTHLQTAHEILSDIGAEAFANRARIELLATGEHARKRSVSTTGALTPQENQIAMLVGEGGTNRDIAARLFISVKTVDYHLRKIFLKLAVSSRTQLARAVLTGNIETPSPLNR